MPENNEPQIINTARTSYTNKSHLFSFSLIPIFLDSLKIIFLENPKFFLAVFTFITLPLSILLTSLSISSTTRFLKSHVARLEWLYRVVPIWIEAANIRDESRAETRRLVRIKLVYSVPIGALSLVAAVLIVVSTHASFRRKKKLTLRAAAAVAALKARWVPPLLTCLVSFILWVMWAHLDPYLNAYAVRYGYLATVLQVAVEVYIMALLGLALVVSVLEGRVGLDAIWVGSGLMKGRRVSGWALSGLTLLITGFIGRQMAGVMYGEDEEMGKGGYTWTAEMRWGGMVGLVGLLGWVVMWSYVVLTVFYVDCRKRHVIKEEEQFDIIDDLDI